MNKSNNPNNFPFRLRGAGLGEKIATAIFWIIAVWFLLSLMYVWGLI